MTTSRRTLIYRGPANGAAAFVEMLERHGVVVAYDPPFKTRSTFDSPEAVTIYYRCTAPVLAIDAARAQFAKSRYAHAGSVTIESSTDEVPNGK